MNQAELQTFLQPDNILCSDSVCSPEGFIEVLTVPATKFRRTVIDIITGTSTFKHPFDLLELANITPGVEWNLYVGTEAKTNFVRLMMKIARNNVTSS